MVVSQFLKGYFKTLYIKYVYQSLLVVTVVSVSHRDVGDSQTSSSCHQHIASPTSATVIDVTIFKLKKL